MGVKNVPFLMVQTLPKWVSIRFLASSILEVNSFKGAFMLLIFLDNSHTSPVCSTSHHDNIAII